MPRTSTTNKKRAPVIWGLIVSRKNSKRLPGKATRALLGKPMASYTFEAASQAKRLDQCWLFTDDEAVIQLAENTPIQVPDFKRPARLSQDQTSTDDTVRYFLSQFTDEQLPDYLVLLQVTSPMRTARDIDTAVDLFLKRHENGEADTLISVTRPLKPLSWLYEFETEADGGIGEIRRFAPDKQTLAMPNGAIYVACPKALLAGGALISGKISGYEMPWQRSIDVDTLEEFLFAETLLRQAESMQFLGKAAGAALPKTKRTRQPDAVSGKGGKSTSRATHSA